MEFLLADDIDGPGAMSFEVVVQLVERGAQTLLKFAMIFPSKEARDEAMKGHGASEGNKQTMDRLAAHLPTMDAAVRNPMVIRLPNDTDIVIERDFDFPAALLFDAWTKPEHVRNWWGCRKTRLSVCDIDLRPGGAWRYVMTQDGQEICAFNGVYQEIARPNRLVHTMIFEPMPDNPSVVTVEFAEKDGKTRVTETTRHDCRESRDAHLNSGMEQGAVEIFSRLTELLAERASDADGVSFKYERVFDAPRDVVFQAWMSAEALAKWWGPRGMGVRVLSFDPQPGGVFHYAMSPPGGGADWHGRFFYRGVNPPEQLVWVNSFADAKGAIVRHPMAPEWPREMLNIVDFHEVGAKTRVALKSFPINADEAERKVFRDGHKSMAGGFGGTLDQLAVYLAKR